MASANFTSLSDKLARGAVNFGADAFKVLLVSAMPSGTQLDAWANRSDVTTEITGAGYTAGGITVTATVGAIDSANNRTPVTFTDLAPGWTAATITASAAIIYKSTGTASTDSLVCAVDFGGSVPCVNGTFSVTFTDPIFIGV